MQSGGLDTREGINAGLERRSEWCASSDENSISRDASAKGPRDDAKMLVAKGLDLLLYDPNFGPHVPCSLGTGCH